MESFAVRLFKSLSDETRLRIALLLATERELCVCELAHALEEIQPKVSRHLAQLRTLGMVSDHRREQWTFYRLRDDLPTWVTKLLDSIVDEKPLSLSGARARLAEMGRRPRDVMSQATTPVRMLVPIRAAKNRSRKSLVSLD